MRIKSYFADSVQEAIEKARLELGPEAMLMNSKKTDFELRSLGGFEVVFGLATEVVPSKADNKVKPVQTIPAAIAPDMPFSSGPLFSPEAGAGLSGDMVKQLADLRQQIETVKRSVTRQQRAAPVQTGMHPHPGAADLCARLMAADLSEDLAQEIAEAAELRAFASRQPANRTVRDFEMVPSEMLEMALHAELDRRLQVAPELGTPEGQKRGEQRRIVLLAGPAGAGKTTALIKLALRYGLRSRQPMHLLSLDTLRVGGWEQLASYARIAGIGFDPVHNWNTLPQLLAQHGNKKLIFIDTPGIGVSDVKEMAALTACCAQQAPIQDLIDVHLVCPATLRTSAGARLLDRFRPLAPAKLLLTHTDEAPSAGSLVELAIRSRLPLSYLSTGQNIPEDIQEASKDRLLQGFAWRAQPAAASAA